MVRLLTIAPHLQKAKAQLKIILKSSEPLTRVLISCFIAVSASLTANPAYSEPSDIDYIPVFAAHTSDNLQKQCEATKCQLNVLQSPDLQRASLQLINTQELQSALALSEYEVLVGTAIVHTGSLPELVFEITTTWRDIPLNELVIAKNMDIASIEESGYLLNIATTIMGEWRDFIETEHVLDASAIYKTLKASDYTNKLHVPTNIGEFQLLESAVYRDPMQGSISRYNHPEFAEAIIDINVFPISPFKHIDKNTTITSASEHVDTYIGKTQALKIELHTEAEHINQLVAQANITDYLISEVEKTSIHINGEIAEGYKLSIALNANEDPVFSTQYVFLQNDKIIKLTGNLPESFMHKVVTQSPITIKVPEESEFMQALRQS